MAKEVQASEIEENLLECRRLLTRSVTDLPDYSTPEKIKARYANFIRESHKAYKEAEWVLIQGILDLENEIRVLKTEKDSVTTKQRIKQLQYWERLHGLFFNTFVWLAMGLDRSNVRKVFKGPKYGALADQNVDSILPYVKEENYNSDNFVVPLDFCSFACIADLMKIDFQPGKAPSIIFIEAKSGKVNEEMLDAIRANDEASYFKFFEQYGPKGIKQIERFFRQQFILQKSTDLMDTDPGVYEHPLNPDEKIVIASNETIPETYTSRLIDLLEASENRKFAVDEIDNCLVIGIINLIDEKFALLGDFDLRLFIYNIYINPAALNEPPNPSELMENFKRIELMDWREGFGSVVLQPIAARPIADKLLMDLLMGRKRLMYFFNAERFVQLCNANGIDARFTTLKEANRMKSQGEDKRLIAFNGRFIKVHNQGIEWTLGDGTFHEIFYNWVRPTSIIAGLDSRNLPIHQSQSKDAV